MKLKDIDFDEFVEWIGKFDEVLEGTEDLLIEAGKEVPVIERLLKIMHNAIENNGPKDRIKMATNHIQCLAALYHLEKKTGYNISKRPVVRGSTSIDRDTGRIRITVYGHGLSESRVLAHPQSLCRTVGPGRRFPRIN